MKKAVSIGLITAVFLAQICTGCGNSDENSSASNGQTNSSPSATADSSSSNSGYADYVNPPGEFPIVKEPITLSAFVTLPPRGCDYEYDKNRQTKYITDTTGINFTWQTVSSEDLQTKLSLMLASNEYTDIIFTSGMSLAELYLYGTQGVLIPLEDLIDTYCVEIPKIFEEYPAAKEKFTLLDGHLYDIPAVNDCTHCSAAEKLWVYTPWLETLGISTPTTTEEFRDMLIRFRDDDPNGNGEKDEIPLAGCVNGWNSNMTSFLMQPFSYTSQYIDDNGKVVVPQMTDGWKEGLKYLHSLYEEGLMYPESLTMDSTQLVALGSNPDVNILGSVPAAYQGGFSTMGEDLAFLDFETIAPLVGPSGRQMTSFDYFGNFGNGMNITSACQYPEAAIRLADFLVTEEITMFTQNGVEGEDWVEAEPGDLGLDGNPAKYRQIVATTDMPIEDSWHQSVLMYRPASFRMGLAADQTTASTQIEITLYNQSLENYYPYALPLENALPPLVYAEQEAAELATLEGPFDSYTQEMDARFISGDLDIDKDWESYIEGMITNGVERIIEIKQAAYDAKMKQ